jgi:hypothetical protein
MKERKDDNVISRKVVDQETGEERTITLHKDHKKPTTRREFLSTGLLGFSGALVAPSILNVLARPEFAFGQGDDSCQVTGAAMPAFIVVNLAGGAHISGELPPLGEDRLPLARYDLLGLGPDQGVFTNNALGSNMFQPGVRVAGTRNAGVPAGHMFLGISLRATQTTIDKTTVVNSCTASNDDTSANQADPTGGVLAAGLTGESLPNLGNRDGTGTGVGQQPAIVRPSAPLIVRNYTDISGALAPAGTLASRLTEPRRKKLLELVNSLSGSQARAVASPGSASGTMLAKVVECATGKNIELASKADPGIDPGLDPGVAAVWGINPANKTGDAYARAAMVYNALKGNASTCSIDDGGHDDHGNGRANQNGSRLRAGEIIGRILETAAVMSKPVFIYVVSDGSQSSDSGSAFGAGFSNDSGTRGQVLFFAYHPSARPAVKNDAFGRQLGFYTPGQGAADDTVVGTPQKAAAAAVANWLSFAGGDNLKKFEAIYPGLFQRSEIDGELVRILPVAS